MLRRRLLFGSVVFLVVGITVAAVGAPWDTPVPRLIPYRGVLENNGVPFDGTVGLFLELYGQESDGTSLWSDTFPTVPVSAGHFSVQIGAGLALPDTVFQTDTLFLQISVDGGLLSGRQRILAMPFSVRSEQALEADHAYEADHALVADHGVPAGTIVAYVGETAPTGWLACDGTAYLVADYSELYAAIGDRFGYGAQGTDFLVPDLRGQFLRGWDAGVGIDPEAAARSAASNGAAGDNIGSRQGHEIQEHDHAWTHRESDAGGGDQAQSWDTSTSDQGSRVYDTGLEGGVETRPINVAVSFIIKCGAADPC